MALGVAAGAVEVDGAQGIEVVAHDVEAGVVHLWRHKGDGQPHATIGQVAQQVGAWFARPEALLASLLAVGSARHQQGIAEAPLQHQAAHAMRHDVQGFEPPCLHRHNTCLLQW